MEKQRIHGRGAQLNTKNRFIPITIEKELSELDEAEIKLETVFYKDNSKSIISKNDSPDVGFEYSINPYRGCEHGCIYCYARPTHEYLGFSGGTDFETKIMIKEDAAKLLEKEFNKKSYRPDVIMLSGNTDCYQPVERKLKITRSILEVCLKYKNPVSVITKNSLILRDKDILSELAKLNLTAVTLSITTLKKELTAVMEPRTSIPERRLHAVKVLAENNIPVGVNVAPVIPGLTDEEIPAILKAAAENGATRAGFVYLRLPFSNKHLFLNWLNSEFPDRAKKVTNKIKEGMSGKLYQPEFGRRYNPDGKIAGMIEDIFYLTCEKYGLNKKRTPLRRDLFSNSHNAQMRMF